MSLGRSGCSSQAQPVLSHISHGISSTHRTPEGAA
jgi:hypothetical protein